MLDIHLFRIELSDYDITVYAFVDTFILDQKTNVMIHNVENSHLWYEC